MGTGDNSFSHFVASDWASAVREAAAKFAEWEANVMDSLNSANPEVRSAAIATLNEAGCAAAHDSVVRLLKDENPEVRAEALEYLFDFARPEDAPVLLALLREKDHLFLASEALNRLCGGVGPVLDSDPGGHIALVEAMGPNVSWPGDCDAQAPVPRLQSARILAVPSALNSSL